jgi:NNP family nitrate/nitrite transporter-like MFS transporter
MKSSFWQAGHKPTLFSAFLYFDLSFMVWVLLGPLAVQMAADLDLTATQKGLMVATPVLAGALLRIVMGVLVDQIKPKMAGLIGQIIVILSLLVAWLHGIQTFQHALLLGLGLGVGTRRNIKGPLWVLPVQVILERYLPPCLHRV